VVTIPLATALAAAFMRTRDAAEDATEAYDGLGESLSRLEDIRLNGIGESLAAGAREAMQEWRQVLDMLERVELRNLESILSSQFDAIVAQLSRYEVQLQTAARLGAQDPEFNLLGLAEFEQGIELARQLQSITGSTREELQESFRAVQQRLEAQQMLTPEVENLLSTLADQLGIVNSITQEVEAQTEAAENSSDALGRLRDAWQDIFRDAQDYRDELKEAADDAAQALAEKVAEAAEEMREAARAAAELKAEMNEAKREATDLGSQLDRLGTLDTSNTQEAILAIARALDVGIIAAGRLLQDLEKLGRTG